MKLFMKERITLTSFLIMMMLLATSYSQNIYNISIGPVWTKELHAKEKPTSWNASIEYGLLFDNIIGVGVDADFTWNVFIKDTVIIPDSIPIHKSNYEKKWFMFPISVFLLADPMAEFTFHPVIKGQVGINMMVKSAKSYDSLGNEVEPDDNGFYLGIIGKGSIDGVFDIGKHAAVFLGFEYQWGRLRKKKKNSNNEFYRPKFYGPGIRMGFSFLF